MRRIICVFAALILSCATLSASARALPRLPKPSPPDYSDVQPSDWFYGDVFFTVERGLINGVTATAFAPDEAATRGMFVTALARYAGVTPSYVGETGFDDVEPGSYYAPYIRWAVETGVARGVSDDRFAPDAPVTREQMSVLLSNYARYAGIVLPDARTVHEFTDASWIGDWARDAVDDMARAGILLGRDDGRFDPQGTAKRCEAAAVLRRYANAAEKPVPPLV